MNKIHCLLYLIILTTGNCLFAVKTTTLRHNYEPSTKRCNCVKTEGREAQYEFCKYSYVRRQLNTREDYAKSIPDKEVKQKLLDEIGEQLIENEKSYRKAIGKS
ncbi:MAG: hypothetical protein KA146_07905 [Leptospiraceae bacterium]|nr:hypothetical protein [Leptospiraceae bacterium]